MTSGPETDRETPTDSGNGDRLADRLLKSEKYEGADKIIIIVLIVIFCALFFWLVHTDKRLFAYWAFLALLTLIFVGVLRAAGYVRSQGTILGGSVAIFVALFAATHFEFEKYQDAQIDKLKHVPKYEEGQVSGWVEFSDRPAAAISKSAFQFRLQPSNDGVEGPFAGNKFLVTATVPEKKVNDKTEEVFDRLTVEYPGYFTGCVLLAADKSDPDCAKIGPDGKFRLTLVPSTLQ